MSKIMIYSPDLTEFIEKFCNEGYIPKKLKNDDHCKLYKRYYNLYDKNGYKVESIFEDDNGIEYYEIKYNKQYSGTGMMFGIKSYPVDEDTFELKYDGRGLQKYSERDIINSKLSLLGAEIKYWFYIHKIDLESEKYSGFSSYLDFRSTSKLMDDKYYLIFAEYVQDKDIYRDCKIVIDKYKEENKE